MEWSGVHNTKLSSSMFACFQLLGLFNCMTKIQDPRPKLLLSGLEWTGLEWSDQDLKDLTLTDEASIIMFTCFKLLGLF